MRALSALAEPEPDIVLPAALTPVVDIWPRLLAFGVLELEEVPEHPASLNLMLTIFPTHWTQSVWNTLIGAEYAHGLTTFSGMPSPASDRFSAQLSGCGGGCWRAALWCAVRHRWIACSDARRRDHLNRLADQGSDGACLRGGQFHACQRDCGPRPPRAEQAAGEDGQDGVHVPAAPGLALPSSRKCCMTTGHVFRRRA